MNRTQKVALAALALLGALVLGLSLRNRQPPFIPQDELHIGVPEADCDTCHGPDGDAFRGRNHPLGSDCSRCHGD